MNKDYQKPEVEFVDLSAQEPVTIDGGGVDGSVGTGDNIYFPS